MTETQRIKELKEMIETAKKRYPDHYRGFFEALLDSERRRIGPENTNEYIRILEDFLQRRDQA